MNSTPIRGAPLKASRSVSTPLTGKIKSATFVFPVTGQLGRSPEYVFYTKYVICVIGTRAPHTRTVAWNVGGRRTFVACSKAYASRISVASLQARPHRDIPIGSPWMNPIGTDMLG